MSLTFICGRSGSGKSRFCLEEIRRQLKDKPGGGPALILLLPEQATFQAERELAGTPGLGGFVRAHVLGFRRLAHRVLSETGGALRPQLNDLGRRMIISHLLARYSEELLLMGSATGRRGYAATLAEMIQEFKNYNIGPEALAAAREAMGDTPLGNKLNDLALIYREFELFLSASFFDPEDYLRLLADKLPASNLLRGASIWIDGFQWFTPAEYGVLEAVLQSAAEVYVSLCLDEPGSGRYDNETALFFRQSQTRKKLRELAHKQHVQTFDIVLGENRRHQARPLLAELEKHFAARYQAAVTPETAGLLLVEAANRRAEAEGIACEIIRLCREEGCRWRDIAVLVRDMGSYAELLEHIFEDYEIPFFCERKRAAVHHPLAEFLRSLLEIYIENWSYEPVFRCLKTGLFPLSSDEVQRLENYVLAFGIRGSRWQRNEEWTFRRKLSLSEDIEPDELQVQQLKEINQIRFRATRPLLAMAGRLNGQNTVAGITAEVFALLEELEVSSRLEAWAVAAEQEGQPEAVREQHQVWNGVVQLFDQLAETCGEQQVTLEEYAQVLNEGLEALELSLIPPGLDHVTISDLERTKIEHVKAVFIPGANEGILPMRRRAEGLLNDKDRELLRQAGLDLAPGVKSDVFAEQFLVYSAFSRAEEFLWVSYPLADEEGKALTPSPLISELKSFVPQVVCRSLAVEPPAESIREYTAHARQNLAGLALSLRRYRSGEPISPEWWDIYNWALTRPELKEHLRISLAGLFHSNRAAQLEPHIAARIYLPNKKLRGSITRLESFRACPFKHFAQYGLQLKERAVFRLAAPDLGQFLHAVLKEFGLAMAKRGQGWGSLSDSECRRVCGEIVDRLAPNLQNEILLSNGQYKHLLGRLKKRVERSVGRLADFDRVSRFKPAAFELPFGGADHGALPALRYELGEGKLLEIGGQIDRLDVLDYNGSKYLLVIDYKSGQARLSLPEIVYGLKLQLLTYLLAACRSGALLFPGSRVQPAGVLYFYLKNPNIAGDTAMTEDDILKEINRQLKMPGWLLKDRQIVRLLDTAIDGWSEFLKVGFGKGDEFYAACQNQLRSEEEFEEILAYIEQLLVQSGRQILSGDVAISPYWLEQSAPCGYCPFRPVCHFDRMLPENEYRILAPVSDAEAIRRIRGLGRDE